MACIPPRQTLSSTDARHEKFSGPEEQTALPEAMLRPLTFAYRTPASRLELDPLAHAGDR